MTRLSSTWGVGHQFGCAGTDFVAEQKLPTWDGNHDLRVELRDRALIGDRERPHLGDLVGPELDADGMLGGGREDIQNAAAHRELAAPGDHVDPDVGQFGQPRDQAVEIEFGADPKGPGRSLRGLVPSAEAASAPWSPPPEAADRGVRRRGGPAGAAASSGRRRGRPRERAAHAAASPRTERAPRRLRTPRATPR